MASETLTTTPLGTTGLDITRVGLGTWAIGGPWDFGWGPQSDADSVAAIHEAVGAGINWIDTAAVYGMGHSEEVVGRAVRELPEGDRPWVFTKCGMVWREGETTAARVGAPESITREVEDSLQRLGVEAIDLYQLHWPPQDGATVEEAWGAIVELIDAGKVRFGGVSNFDAAQLEACEAIRHVSTLQPPLSALQRGVLGDTLDWCAAHDTGVIVYSPMQAGLLTGGWSHERFAALDEGDWRRKSDHFLGELFDRNLAFVDRLRPIAERLGASLGELAIAWTLAQRGVTGAISGARKPGQVAGWAGAGEVRLDDATLAEITSALRETGAGRG
ncbi:MAG: aldo/keto reductase [Solirubrobacteraceae bacterium]|nr:aldo/keto reductase [Solirubrobacteraceae bacterium]